MHIGTADPDASDPQKHFTHTRYRIIRRANFDLTWCGHHCLSHKYLLFKRSYLRKK
jgi:hypothetical protein